MLSMLVRVLRGSIGRKSLMNHQTFPFFGHENFLGQSSKFFEMTISPKTLMIAKKTLMIAKKTLMIAKKTLMIAKKTLMIAKKTLMIF